MNDSLAVPLISKNGVRGKVLTTSRLLDDSREKSVIFEGGQEASVSTKHLHLQPDGTYFLDQAVEPQARPSEVVIPVIHEIAHVTKRKVETGRVRVRKTVSEEPATIDLALVHEEYEVVRIPVNKVVETKAPTRVDGDTTIIPVYEEETVTVTRLILREEVHLVKKERIEHRPHTITLRKESAEVERIPTKPAALL